MKAVFYLCVFCSEQDFCLSMIPRHNEVFQIPTISHLKSICCATTTITLANSNSEDSGSNLDFKVPLLLNIQLYVNMGEDRGGLLFLDGTVSGNTRTIV